MEKRLGFVGIVVDDREKVSASVNKVISEYGDIIIARLGVPYLKKEVSVITLVVDATTDEIGKLTGKLGMIEGISVKSAMSKRG